jgi:hypothetical protein
MLQVPFHRCAMAGMQRAACNEQIATHSVQDATNGM